MEDKIGLFKAFYTNWGVATGFAGVAYGPFIFIRPKYREDVGLLEHEKVHVRQFWKYLVLFWILYYTSQKYRLRFEVEAYREQLKWYDDDRTQVFAGFLVNKYGLDITTEAAAKLLKAP